VHYNRVTGSGVVFGDIGGYEQVAIIHGRRAAPIAAGRSGNCFLEAQCQQI
jgi:hypothetical protein